MRKRNIKVSFSVELDVDQWGDEYAISTGASTREATDDARQQIRLCASEAVNEYLRRIGVLGGVKEQTE